MNDSSCNPTMMRYLQQLKNGNANQNLKNIVDALTSSNSAIEFSSNTGNGGTWQRNGGSSAPSASSAVNSSNGLMNGYSLMGGFTNNGSNGLIAFKCVECAISKNSCEELEIHIKTEHLNWLPFQCTMCAASRASDTQMREHVFSHHKMNDMKYVYVDNQNAKRSLQAMLDRALIAAATMIASKPRSGISNGTSSAPSKSSASSGIKRPRLSDDESAGNSLNGTARGSASATVTINPKPMDILAQLQSQNGSSGDESGGEEQRSNGGYSITEGAGTVVDDAMEDVDEHTSNQLNNIFGSAGLRSEFDDYSTTPAFGDIDNSLIENISALFNASGVMDASFGSPAASGKSGKTRAPRGSRQVNCVSKKRVLGECSRCQKPVTAGARQMHMFYHLGKDYNTYRFKCKFDNCDVEHYRKDQMENHQSKQHGGIDPSMMEDRSAELAETVQQLSLELLGTTGNTPGPTAARAQIMYDNMQREAAEAANKKKRRFGITRVDYTGGGASGFHSDMNGTSPSTSYAASPAATKFGAELDPSFVKPETKRNEDFIKCMLCSKVFLNRVRGFHLLWHLNNDLGIIRYACKYCDFKHERPQSVSTHGKRDHDDPNCVDDLLSRYEEEVKMMSKKCYGVEQLFAKDIKVRKKEPDVKVEDILGLADGILAESDENQDDLRGDSQDEDGEVKCGAPVLMPQLTASHLAPMKGHGHVDADSDHYAPAAASSSSIKKKSTRRFGTRRPKSKKQKQDMQKLREISMVLGGAQYFRKKPNEVVFCQKCGKSTHSRLSHHAYNHLDVALFTCTSCTMGSSNRDGVVKHMKEIHGSSAVPVDHRLRYAQSIKDMIQECYPDHFIDAPIPTPATIEKLRSAVDPDGSIIGGLEGENEDDNDADEEETEGTESHIDLDDEDMPRLETTEVDSDVCDDEPDDDVVESEL